MADVSDQLRPDVLRERLSASAVASGYGSSVSDVQEFGGGSSGLTFTAILHATSGTRRTVVVKVAPPALPPVHNRDVLRQARILETVRRGSTVPVPEVVFTDAGAPPEVPPLFVMAHVDGECFEPRIDATDDPPDGRQIAGRALGASRLLGALHSIDVAAIGLGEEPVVALDEELARWERMLDRSAIDLGDRPRRTIDALRDQMPAAATPRLVHGDFRLGNQICEGSSVRAILDWEIWTVSDPRIDVGWFLMTFDPDGLPSAVREPAADWPTSRELLEVYESAVGAPVSDVGWFSALARLRSAAAMSLNVKHNRRRATPSARIEAYAALLPDYLDAALRRLEGP
jgi:aminoglycoside phosphotransferase (APT) family kinase protein